MLFCGHAYAQVSESDIGSESGVNESISRLTSTFEVKRAVIGLLIIAAVSVIVFFFYFPITNISHTIENYRQNN